MEGGATRALVKNEFLEVAVICRLVGILVWKEEVK